MPTITKKQKAILDFIISFIQDNDYSPSYQEIADNFGLSSRATVHQHVQALQDKGYLTNEGSLIRGLTPVEEKVGLSQAFELPLAGLITAGQPIEAVEQRETIAIPAHLVLNPANSYVLQVKGESMIDEGILDGDLVIVDNNPSPRNGDVVVALLNNQYATLKKFYREANRIRLQPANKAMKPIYSKDPLIQGVVQGIIRKFKTA